MTPDELARSIVGRVEPEGDAGEIAVGLITSAWEIYRAIRALLERRLAEEARMLSRTLIDNAALLMWFVTRSDELELLALRYHWTSAMYSRDVAAAAHANGWKWAEDMFLDRGREIEALRKAARDFGLDEPDGLPNTREILEELKESRLYYWHSMASQVIHSTAIGVSARFRPPEEEGGTTLVAMESEPKEVARVGILYAEIFVSALAAASRILGWDEARVREFGDGFSPRAEAFYREITGEPDATVDPPATPDPPSASPSP